MMDRDDARALHQCLALYRQKSPRARSEVVELEARYSWRRAAFYACQKMQAAALGLNGFQLTPSELSPDSPLHVPGGDDSRRAEMIEIVQQLTELGLSLFVPNPLQAIEEAQRQAPAADGAA